MVGIGRGFLSASGDPRTPRRALSLRDASRGTRCRRDAARRRARRRRRGRCRRPGRTSAGRRSRPGPPARRGLAAGTSFIRFHRNLTSRCFWARRTARSCSSLELRASSSSRRTCAILHAGAAGRPLRGRPARQHGQARRASWVSGLTFLMTLRTIPSSSMTNVVRSRPSRSCRTSTSRPTRRRPRRPRGPRRRAASKFRCLLLVELLDRLDRVGRDAEDDRARRVVVGAGGRARRRPASCSPACWPWGRSTGRRGARGSSRAGPARRPGRGARSPAPAPSLILPMPIMIGP